MPRTVPDGSDDSDPFGHAVEADDGVLGGVHRRLTANVLPATAVLAGLAVLLLLPAAARTCLHASPGLFCNKVPDLRAPKSWGQAGEGSSAGKSVPVSSADAVQSFLANSGSLAAVVRPTSVGLPRISSLPPGPT
jgi:hypothetical protein